jgi:aryl-alcohol dehydrogenase-like predicted oxidoreductase
MEARADAAGTVRIAGELPVHRLGFGAMRITGTDIWGPPRDRAEARRVLKRAVALGVNFIDTADSYGPGASEELIAEALHPYPRYLVIATKGGIVRPMRARWDPDCRPEHLRAACESSLKRLRLERIDLYQLHTIDPRVRLEDSIGELVRLQSEGKICHIGVSNVRVAELDRARRLATIVSVQNRYNVADRTSDPVLAACERDGLVFIPWRPLAQGTGELVRTNGSIVALARLAKARGLTMSQAAIAWLLARSPAMLPIPGTARVAHLEENVAAADAKLTLEEMRAIG